MKFLELCGWNILILKGPPVTLFLLGLLVFILSIICNCRLPRRALIFWFTMSLAIITFSVVDFSPLPSDAGQNPPVFAYIDTALMPLALLRIFRLLLMLMCSHLFISTTDLLSITETLRWVSRPLPQSWSIIFSLTFAISLGFVTWLMDSASRIREAAISRALSARYNPFRYALHLSLPLAHITLRRAEITADAMLSRNVLNRPRIQSTRLSPGDFLLFLLFVFLPPGGGIIILSF